MFPTLAEYQSTQVFIDTLAAQRPNNLIKQEKVQNMAEQLDKTRKGLKHVTNTINLRNKEKGQAHCCYRIEPGNDLRL